MTEENPRRLDLDAAERELIASATINHEGTRRGIVAQISAVALLDIARSLRPIAEDAQIGIDAWHEKHDETIYPDDDEKGPAWMLLDVGDHVESDEGNYLGQIKQISIREDEPCAFVADHDVEDDGGWIFLRYLTRIARPEVDELSDDTDAPKPATDTAWHVTPDAPVEAADEIDDDDDIEGDFPPASSALDALRDLAEGKPKKKGKKS